MYKIFSNIFIGIGLSLLIGVLLAPDASVRVADKVLDTISTNDTVQSIGDFGEKIKPLAPITDSQNYRLIESVLFGDSRSDDSTSLITSAGIIDATNRERIARDLPPLQVNTKLTESAMRKTNDMIARQYFEHDSPNGKGVSDLGREVGYDYVVMGENLALGNFATSDDVVKAWMDSPGHRANMLSSNYQEIGVYAAKATYQGREVWFAVQHFGTGRAACPSISSSLKSSIDALNADLKARQVYIVTEKALLESPNRPGGEEYRARVEAFNNLVSEYNTTLVVSQEKIKEYNAQVNAFNNCLLRYQTK
jgi:uncharacterized protein YkwD